MQVYIEVSKGSNLKYEHDKISGMCVLDRVLHNTHSFPYNYGYIPDTLSPDGDPLDVIVTCPYALFPGTMVKVKVLGAIKAIDEAGEDDKIIAVPIDKCDPRSKHFNDITDINETELDEIKYFLKRYKDGEKNKFMDIGDVVGKEKADEIIKESFLAFKKTSVKSESPIKHTSLSAPPNSDKPMFWKLNTSDSNKPMFSDPSITLSKLELDKRNDTIRRLSALANDEDYN